jgi:hypothetical protein
MKIADVHALVRWFDGNSAIDDLTLGQLVEIKASAPVLYKDINAWLASDPNAMAEFQRVVAGEPHRRGLKLKIATDDTAQDPREAHDHLGRMVCWHRRHKLGDEQPREEPDTYRAQLPEGSIVIDLYLYDHSGLRMRTSAFDCRWDSGLVGFIYATPEVIAKEFGAYDTMTDDLRDKVVTVLESEVVTYDAFLSGNVWGFVLENADGDTLDSCWGFYGDDKDGIACHLPEDAKELLEDAWRTRGPLG